MKAVWSREKYIEAFAFAANAHLGMTMPGSELPYVTHLSFVCMEIIAALNFDNPADGDLAVQCALLHDTIEDAETTYADLKAAFGKDVADGVRALTKNENLEKSERMRDSLARIKAQPVEIWMVKLADRISNLRKPPHYWTPEKIRSYRREAVLILESLKEADSVLVPRLEQKIEDYRRFCN